MNSNIHRDARHKGNYLLTYDQYLVLDAIRDKFMLMAQLAGSNMTLRDTDAHLYVRRALLGEMFGDASIEIGEVLGAAKPMKEPMSVPQ